MKRRVKIQRRGISHKHLLHKFLSGHFIFENMIIITNESVFIKLNTHVIRNIYTLTNGPLFCNVHQR
jgi:hypothetical protein